MGVKDELLGVKEGLLVVKDRLFGVKDGLVVIEDARLGVKDGGGRDTCQSIQRNLRVLRET